MLKRLFRAEWKKLFKKRSAILTILLLCLLILCLDALSAYRSNKLNCFSKPVLLTMYREDYPQFRGPLNYERTKEFIRKYNELDERLFTSRGDWTKLNEDSRSGFIVDDQNYYFREFYEPLNYAFSYAGYVQAYQKQLSKLGIVEGSRPDRSIDHFYNYDRYEHFLLSPWPSIAIVLSLAILLADVLPMERDHQMTEIIGTSIAQSCWILAKCLFVWTLTALVSLGAFMIQALCLRVIYPFSEKPAAQLYELKTFANTSFAGTMEEAMLSKLVLSLLGALVFACVFLYLSSFLEQRIYYYIAALSFSAVCFLLPFVPIHQDFRWLRLLNPARLFRPELYWSEGYFLQNLSWPGSRDLEGLIAMALVSLILAGALLRPLGRREIHA